MAIGRLNAILAIARRPAQLEFVGDWVKRLDRSTAVAGRQVYVYYARNARAAELASTLGQVFLGTAPKAAKKSTVAPGLTPVAVGGADSTTPDPSRSPRAGGTHKRLGIN